MSQIFWFSNYRVFRTYQTNTYQTKNLSNFFCKKAPMKKYDSIYDTFAADLKRK